MDSLKAQARILESLLASFILIAALIMANPYFMSSSLIKKDDYKEELAYKLLSFMIYKDILKQIYFEDYFLIIETLEKTIPLDYGFKISVYDDNMILKWSYQRGNFDERNARSAQVILNGCEGNVYTYFLIVSLAIS